MSEKPENAVTIGLALIFIAVILTIGGLWWWALLCMVGKVGTALSSTVLLSVIVGVMLVVL